MSLPRFLTIVLPLLALPTIGFAQVIEDWGTVVTPIETDTSFSFEQFDVEKNFTHDYLFSLEGEAGASYAVTFQFDACSKGCGNPDLSYGIYDANGGLYATDTGTVVLAVGNYAFQVKGTGFGSGNSVDYFGSVTFSAASVSLESMVAPVPEPTTLVLTGVGAGIVMLAGIRRRRPRLAAAEPEDSGYART